MSLKATFYKSPDGRPLEIDVVNVYEADEAWFRDHNVKISMEDLGDQFAVYADIGRRLPDDVSVDEVLVLSGPMTCQDTLAKLRFECEKALKEAQP